MTTLRLPSANLPFVRAIDTIATTQGRCPGLEEFEIRTDFLVFRGFDEDARPIFDYVESKASINGAPGWRSLSDNQKVFLEAWLRDPGSVSLSRPAGQSTAWDNLIADVVNETALDLLPLIEGGIGIRQVVLQGHGYTRAAQ